MTNTGYSQKLIGERSREFLTVLMQELPKGRSAFESMLEARGVSITIKPLMRRRSLDQNSLYWAQMEIIGNHLGTTKSETHSALAGMILGYRPTPLGPVPKSTSGLNSVEFSNYLEQVNAFAATELGIRLPVTPDEWDAYDAR